jgi:hypothetical protein
MPLRIVRRQTTYWDLAGDGRSLRVHFLDKQEYCFVQAEVPSFEITDDHPLLIPHKDPWQSVYISASLQQPEAFHHSLLAVLNAELSPWRRAETYFNRQADPISILRDGYGLLFEGPSPLAEILSSWLTEYHVASKSFTSLKSRGPMRAFVAGRNYVIAREFRVAES